MLTAASSSLEIYSCVPSWLMSKFSGSEPPGIMRSDLILRDVEDGDTIGAMVRRRKRALIHVRPGNRCAAQRNINRLVIRAGVDPRGRLPSGTVASTL